MPFESRAIRSGHAAAALHPAASAVHLALAARAIVAVLLLALSTHTAAAQNRPIPYPVSPTPPFEAAVNNGTRTTSGEPGPRYWTNRARYDLHATVSPRTAMLRGTGSATYFNHSPDTLRNLHVHLHQNLHAPGAVRNRAQQITGGMHVAEVRAGGTPLLERAGSSGPGYSIDDTVMDVRLPAPVPPGDSTTLHFAWSFEIPEAGAPRMGQDGEVFYLGYWYPQFAVYDDVHGWVAEPYQGNGEFYMGYADYHVAVTVPAGFIVAATGELVNPDEVLSAQTRRRLAAVNSGEEIHSIVGPDERGAGTSTRETPDGMLTWRFGADDVRDFAFGTSDAYVWDATLADAGGGRTTQIHTLYRPGAAAWDRSAEFARYSIEYLSDRLTPYPYPHMTVVEGIIGGGMEYPMITLIGGNRTHPSLFGTTFHEISHMWVPMLVGQNEKRYTWMDEGLTVYNTNEGKVDFWGDDAWNPDIQTYFGYAGTGLEAESMRHADEYPHGTSARVIASYNKPALVMRALEFVLGRDTFDRAYREYIRRWTNRHPYPYDLFNTFEEAAGRDLDWFWTSMLYETWTLDHAVADVVSENDGVVVTVEDLGLVPMPVPVYVTYDDGSTASEVVQVDVWLSGARRADVRFEPGTVARVDLDPEAYLPDFDRTNNTWEVEVSGLGSR